MRRALVAALLLSTGCGTDVCGAFKDQACIALHLRAASGSSLPALDEIDVSVAGMLTMSRKPGGGTASLPIVLAILPGMALTNAPIAVTARDNGAVAGSVTVMGSVAATQHVDLYADVIASPAGDMNAGSLDLAEAIDGGVAVGAACNLSMQSGCGAGEKCTIANNGAFCAPDGTVAAGGACSGSPDDCVQGSVCIGGICHPLCGSDSDCKQPAVDGVGPRCTVPLPGLVNKACTIACNPVLAAGDPLCPTSSACVYTPSATSEATDCSPPGSSVEGDSCDNSTECAANLTCILNGAPPGHCRAVCRNGVAGDCVAADSCTSVGAQYGVCCPAGGC